MKNKIKQIFDLIDNSKDICILGHTAPDGDCIGSCLAMHEYITSKYKSSKTVYAGFDGKIPYNYERYIKSDMNTPDLEKKYDLTLILDCGDVKRLGKYSNIIENSYKTVCIDHHVTNTEFADINIIEPHISSTGELLYNIFEIENIIISNAMAKYLYISILTDTGKFSYNSTSSKTHIVAAKLIELGVNVDRINNEIYNSKPVNLVKAFIECISNIHFYYENKLGIVRISKDIIDRNNIDMNDIDGVVEFIREIGEIQVSCVLKEYLEDVTKVSLRAKNDIDVSMISKSFGGGGHKKAAGFQIRKSLSETEDIIVEEMKKYMGE